MKYDLKSHGRSHKALLAKFFLALSTVFKKVYWKITGWNPLIRKGICIFTIPLSGKEIYLTSQGEKWLTEVRGLHFFSRENCNSFNQSVNHFTQPFMTSATPQLIIGSLGWWTISFLHTFKGNNDSFLTK